jgi:hypothetical protein
MADAPPPGHPPKYPPRVSAPVLALPRRRATTRAPFGEGAPDVHESITHIVESTRASFNRPDVTPPEQLSELEKSLRKLEVSLAERERLLADASAKLAERERDVAEAEALLLAREKLLVASRHETTSPLMMSKSERDALDELKRTLDQQAASLAEAKHALREREQFLDESENRLFEKVQAQQEKESELEQREEDIRTQRRKLRETRAAFDPEAAAELKAEDEAAKKRDEFNE